MEPNLISCFKKSSKSGLVNSDTKRDLIHKKSCEPLLVSLWFLVIGCHYWASIWIIFIFQGFRLSSRFVLSALDFNEADKQVVRGNLVLAILRHELPCKNQIEFAQKSATEQKLSHCLIGQSRLLLQNEVSAQGGTNMTFNKQIQISSSSRYCVDRFNRSDRICSQLQYCSHILTSK